MGKISMTDGLKAGLGWSIGTAIGGLVIAAVTAVATPLVVKVGAKLASVAVKLKGNDTKAEDPEFEEAA